MRLVKDYIFVPNLVGFFFIGGKRLHNEKVVDLKDYIHSSVIMSLILLNGSCSSSKLFDTRRNVASGLEVVTITNTDPSSNTPCGHRMLYVLPSLKLSRR